jgi:hypothetical protein
MKQSTRRIDSNTHSVGELLRRPLFYTVPVYQRDFSWTSDETSMLWEDITSALFEERNEYFLGAIVLSPGRDERSREIVDGQQRLAVLAMIFASITEQWSSRDDEKRATGVQRDFLGSEDRRTGEIVAKLSLNETNNAIFQSLVLKHQSFTTQEKKSWPESNRLLDDAFSSIRQSIKDWASQFDNPESALLNLEEFLDTKTNLIVIEVDDEADAFIIFETLNDRGLDLAVSDLVKNYLFSLAESHIERFKKIWIEMSLLIGAENLTSFLRHFWLSEYELVRERDLYRELRKKVRQPAAARQFMERLRKVADLYAALTNPEHPYWTDFPVDARNSLEAVLLFKVTQFRPLMLAAMEVTDSRETAKILRSVAVISFRYTVVSALGTGNLEKIYSDAALSVRKGQHKSGKSVFNMLKGAYVDDRRFTENFATRPFTKAPITRYILAALNDSVEKDPERQVAEPTGRMTVEHIMPKNPGKEWRGAVPKDSEPGDFVDLIGNLTLLEKGRNRGIAAAGFREKKARALSQSSLALNKELCREDVWTSTEILARSSHLARLARQIWRIDY